MIFGGSHDQFFVFVVTSRALLYAFVVFGGGYISFFLFFRWPIVISGFMVTG